MEIFIYAQTRTTYLTVAGTAAVVLYSTRALCCSEQRADMYIVHTVVGNNIFDLDLGCFISLEFVDEFLEQYLHNNYG